MIITELSQLDLSKQYTYADYLAWQFTERVELIKGYIRQMSGPNTLHQDISGELLYALKNHIKANKGQCKVFAAPYDVRLVKNPEGKTDKEIYSVVQPDLLVVCDRSKIDTKGCKGAPDLIIEILSKSNQQTDLKDKFLLYQENGVPEYWIVYPNDQIVHQFVLENETYRLKSVYTSEQKAVPMLFPDLEIDLSVVFEEI